MIDLRQVCKTFRKQDEKVDAVRDISMTIAQKEIVAIIGPSGCGKSTLLNMIAGLYPPTSGSIVYKGAPVEDVNTDVGYMTQKDNLLPWRSVRDNIAFPLELSGIAKRERAERADQVIAHVGLEGFAHRYPHELSGGMRKRACLARMLLYGAETALLDEPFAALDAQLKLAMHDLLMKLAAETGQTVVFVTHDLMEPVTLADRVMVCTRRPATVARRWTGSTTACATAPACSRRKPARPCSTPPASTPCGACRKPTAWRPTAWWARKRCWRCRRARTRARACAGCWTDVADPRSAEEIGSRTLARPGAGLVRRAIAAGAHAPARYSPASARLGKTIRS